MRPRCPYREMHDEPGMAICRDCYKVRPLPQGVKAEELVRYCGKPKVYLGDAIHKLANVVGFREQCEGCKKRQQALNKLDREARKKIKQGWKALSELGRKNINAP